VAGQVGSREEARVPIFLGHLGQLREAEEEGEPQLGLEVGMELVKGTRRGGGHFRAQEQRPGEGRTVASETKKHWVPEEW